MRTENTILRLLHATRLKLGSQPKHSQAHLFVYEVVTIGLLYALKGGSFRAFHRYLAGDWAHLFSGPIPERSRLLRLLTTYAEEANTFLASPSAELVIDTFGMEMLHPWRAERGRRRAAGGHGRMPKTLARKGLSNRRWMVGAKFCCLLRPDGRIVDFAWDSANVADNSFNCLVEDHAPSLVLADLGFRAKDHQPDNLICCTKAERSDRMVVETVFSMLTMVVHSKRLWRRAEQHITAQLTYLVAMFNVVTRWSRGRLTLARWSL